MNVNPPSIIATMINLALKMGKLGTEENIYPLNGPPYNDFVHTGDNLPVGRKDF